MFSVNFKRYVDLSKQLLHNIFNKLYNSWIKPEKGENY